MFFFGCGYAATGLALKFVNLSTIGEAVLFEVTGLDSPVGSSMKEGEYFMGISSHDSITSYFRE